MKFSARPHLTLTMIGTAIAIGTVGLMTPAIGQTITVEQIQNNQCIRQSVNVNGEVITQSYSCPSNPYQSYPTNSLVTSVYRRGAQGPVVAQIQQALRNRGYDLPVDGLFGAHTELAVINFQQRVGLAADGIVGPATFQALGSLPPIDDDNDDVNIERQYVVVVPGDSRTLYQVQEQTDFRTACLAESGRGQHVQAITVQDNEYLAESYASRLRDQGLDARVEYLRPGCNTLPYLGGQ